MQIITGPRGSGKTSELIKKAVKDSLILVCSDQRRARHIADLARSMGLNPPKTLLFTDLLSRKHRGLLIQGFLIDDIEDCLMSVTGDIPILAIACTNPFATVNPLDHPIPEED